MRFVDFPDSFDPNRNIFVKLLEVALKQKITVIVDTQTSVDVEFASNFIRESMLNRLISRIYAQKSKDAMDKYEQNWVWGFRSEYPTKTQKRIWYTGENLRPPLGFFDGTMSFNQSDDLTKNHYFPFWMQRIDWFNDSKYFEICPEPAQLIQKRVPVERNLNICTFSSKYEPGREKIIRSIPRNSEFQGFGLQYSKPVESKLKTSSNFGLQVCSENDLYPNYVTEKLIESWFARCVPIWAGLDHYNHFNKEAFIDVTNLSSQEIRDRVSNLNKDELMYIQSQHILNEIPDINHTLEFLRNVIE